MPCSKGLQVEISIFCYDPVQSIFPCFMQSECYLYTVSVKMNKFIHSLIKVWPCSEITTPSSSLGLFLIYKVAGGDPKIQYFDIASVQLILNMTK